ncbi:asialoglycoprotein receptor 1-like isoform X2 [Sceloporus undulatus]|uniref:asialoglycoprotein receptor 1-like isoform X2 n=1 Tax=Sceloporus undulatus TaxID=8520 RepID=UPI001C4C07D0|nr:asialoglycoprotein receptor 1-like isoform X2 [Sceloporus undulatus]
MTKDYRDVASVETEDEGDLPVRTDFAPRQSWGRRICSGRRLILILLGLLCVLVIMMVAFGFSGRKFDGDLLEMQENLKSINRTVFLELAALKEKEANEGKAFTKMNAMAKNLTAEVKEAKTHFEEHISKLQTSFLKMNCDLEDTKHNRSGTSKTVCCPKDWFSFAGHCYWFSRTEKNWAEAKADCENKDAHLVIITSYLEQQFVAQHTKPRHFWIGLSYSNTNQKWKWVDGTTYTIRRM